MQSYYSGQPFKLLHSATIHAARLNKHLNQHDNKYPGLRELASKQRDAVKSGIEKSTRQNELFRKLEEQDQKRRNSIQSSLEARANLSVTVKQKVISKTLEMAKKNNLKVQKTFQKHEEQLKDQIQGLQEESIKIQQQRAKELDEKERAKVNKLKSKRSYDQALLKIKARESLVEEFAAQTLMRIQNSFGKNYRKANPELEETRSQKIGKYTQVLAEEKLMLGRRTEKFLQNHCQRIESGIEMRQKKRETWEKVGGTIQKYNKSNSERTNRNKEYLDEQSAVVPEKCQGRLNNSLISDDNRGASNPFFNSARSWRSQNKTKKSHLRQIQQRQHDSIIDRHFQTTFKNRGEDRIYNKFLDLQKKASFNARQFL